MNGSFSRVIDAERQRRHQWTNIAHTIVLLAGMLALLSACAWIVAGPEGVLWALVGGGFALLISPRISPRLALSMYRARELTPRQIPRVYEILVVLAGRAELPAVPRLYHVPSSTLNAFALGAARESAIAVTDGMLRMLSMRELAGVLAHEISHIRNRDLWVMNLADTISRLTRAMALLGMVLLIVTLPLWLAEYGRVPWLLIVLLMLAPTAGGLLQLALSRTREFDADLMAATLTGDAVGLASALEKLERLHAGPWEKMLRPGHRIPDPSLLRTHPETEERVRRLLSLRARDDRLGLDDGDVIALPGNIPRVSARPRRHVSGLWY